jgi:endoglucanase
MVYLPSFGTQSTLSGALCVYGELKSTTNLIPNGTYEIINVNGLALESPGFSHTDGLDMDQWTVNGGGNQLWSLINLGSNIVTLTNGYSSQVLDVAGASKTAGALVDQWPNNNQAANEEWQIVSLGDSKYELTSVNSGLALDVVGASTSTGAKIDQYTYHSGTNQQWTFTAVPY